MSDLICRNVRISGRRTSIKLEAHMWEALEEICRLSDRSVHQLCTEIAARGGSSNFTSRVRVFILGYFRARARPQPRYADAARDPRALPPGG